MKVAVTSTNPTIEANVDPRFGRCSYFVFVDTETMKFEAADNPGASAGGGAGIATAQSIAEKGVNAVLTGNCGPNAYKVLNAAGIKVITGVSGTIRQAVEDFKAGKYQESSAPSVSGHYGLGRQD